MYFVCGRDMNSVARIATVADSTIQRWPSWHVIPHTFYSVTSTFPSHEVYVLFCGTDRTYDCDGQQSTEGSDALWFLRLGPKKATLAFALWGCLFSEPSCPAAVGKPRAWLSSQLTASIHCQAWEWAFRGFQPLAFKWPPASEAPRLTPCRTGRNCPFLATTKCWFMSEIQGGQLLSCFSFEVVCYVTIRYWDKENG